LVAMVVSYSMSGFKLSRNSLVWIMEKPNHWVSVILNCRKSSGQSVRSRKDIFRITKRGEVCGWIRANQELFIALKAAGLGYPSAIPRFAGSDSYYVPWPEPGAEMPASISGPTEGVPSRRQSGKGVGHVTYRYF
jgi:hypothetical protein